MSRQWRYGYQYLRLERWADEAARTLMSARKSGRSLEQI